MDEEKQYLSSYYLRHKDELLEKYKNYYHQNKEALLEKQKERGYKKWLCEACKKEVLLCNKTNHLRTNKHKNNVKLQPKK